MEVSVVAVITAETVSRLEGRECFGQILGLVAVYAVAIGPDGALTQMTAMLRAVKIADAPARGFLGRRAFGFDPSRLTAKRAGLRGKTEFWSSDVKRMRLTAPVEQCRKYRFVQVYTTNRFALIGPRLIP